MNEDKVVFKYPVSIGTSFTLDLPVAAKILDIQVQHGESQMWCLVNPDVQLESRSFHVVGTGHQEVKAGFDYVATFQTNNGMFVWHLFEDRHARSTPFIGPNTRIEE